MKKYMILALFGASAHTYGMQYLFFLHGVSGLAVAGSTNIVPRRLLGWLQQPMSRAEKAVLDKFRLCMTATALVASFYGLRNIYLEKNNPYQVLPRSALRVYLGGYAHELCVIVNKDQHLFEKIGGTDLLYPSEFTKIDWEKGYGKRAIDTFIESWPFVARDGQVLNLSKNSKRQLMMRYLQGKTASLRQPELKK